MPDRWIFGVFFFGFILTLLTDMQAQTQSLPKAEQAMVRQKLVNIHQVDSSILVELKYSTTDNFVGKDVYDDLTEAYLQPIAARKLAQANAILKNQHPHLRLLVYDAARPRSAQWNLWNALPQYPEKERRKYVADPRLGSIHNYGCAVDLTVADVSNPAAGAKALDMGTKYDFFGPLAYPKEEVHLLKTGQLTQKQSENRKLLRSVMQQAGFTPIEYEWWHFNALSHARAKATYTIVE